MIMFFVVMHIISSLFCLVGGFAKSLCMQVVSIVYGGCGAA
jgi:hypothetical protein